MKISYKHLTSRILSSPSTEELSEKLFQLGHEHDIDGDIFDIEITPNRGDCLSINGLLRDLAAFYDVNIAKPLFKNEIDVYDMNFINNAIDACPNISFLFIEIDKSTNIYKDELRNYFDDLDINKNNFFTDISNYISYETGQPTHCYDSTRITNKVSLEISKEDKSFETLLGKKINLTNDNLVFIQNNKVINLAGVMGGIDTGCSESTRSVIVECANFNPEYILGKSVKYDLVSDAAHKFERGVDPNCHEHTLRRFIDIVNKHANIKTLKLYNENFEEKSSHRIACTVHEINNVLGTSITKSEFASYLIKLGFNIEDSFVIVPSYRNDVKSVNDICEEIARVIGYNNIEIKPIALENQKTFKAENSIQSVHVIKEILVAHGFNEVINNPFVKSKSEFSIRVDNPLDSNKSFLRRDLQKSLISNMLFNERRQKDCIKLFEVSDIYTIKDGIIQRKNMLGIICTGRIGENYRDFSKKVDIEFLSKILKKIDSKIYTNPTYIPRDTIKSKLNDKIVYFEAEIEMLNIDCGLKFNQRDINFIKYEPVSEYPSSYRDLSFSLKDPTKFFDLQSLIINTQDKLLKDVYMFDYYDSKKNNEIKVGFRFIFQSYESTITDSDVNQAMNKIISASLRISSVTIPGL